PLLCPWASKGRPRNGQQQRPMCSQAHAEYVSLAPFASGSLGRRQRDGLPDKRAARLISSIPSSPQVPTKPFTRISPTAKCRSTPARPCHYLWFRPLPYRHPVSSKLCSLGSTFRVSRVTGFVPSGSTSLRYVAVPWWK